MWTFQGTIPPKLVQGKYGEPIIFRHHNRLPADVTANNGFGRHTISTHEHNGHHGAENDGFTGAFFFPNQFYDYHWPIVLAGRNTINTDATDIRASSPDGSGGLTKSPGDFHETMSTHWFHDHMFSFTSQNVYKGNAAMFNIYSGLDRGNEAHQRRREPSLPSGTAKDFGNLDYDVNLMLADKAFDSTGQLYFDIFNFDGFLGDAMTVNLAYLPFFEVERRKYRFRILNASVSRFFKYGSVRRHADDPDRQRRQPAAQRSGTQAVSDEQGIAERYDWVIDFSRCSIGSKVWLVNVAEHQTAGSRHRPDNCRGLVRHFTIRCVGKFLEFRIVRDPAQPDKSRDLRQSAPDPESGSHKCSGHPGADVPLWQRRNQPLPASDPAAFVGPWGVGTDGGPVFNASFGRISAAPKFGTREVWTLQNGGGGWDHPIHIHFEEGQILARNGSASNVPAWEQGRKDVYRLRPGGSVTLTLQFRDFGGMYMEHCHNTVHEDNAMLVRWEISDAGTPFLNQLPTPIAAPTGVTFAAPDDIAPTAF